MQITINNTMGQALDTIKELTQFETILDYANYLLQIHDGKENVKEINFLPSELIVTTELGTDIVVFLAGYPNLTAIKLLIMAGMDTKSLGADDVNIECDIQDKTIHIWISE